MTSGAWEPTPYEIDAYMEAAALEASRLSAVTSGRGTAITRAGLAAAYAALRDRLFAPDPVTLAPDPPTIVTLTPPIMEYTDAEDIVAVERLADEGWRVHTVSAATDTLSAWFLMERQRPDQPDQG